MGTILLVILGLIVAFVVLGLLGWVVQAIGLIGSFFGEGITGCFGCVGKFFWAIIVILVFLALVL